MITRKKLEALVYRNLHQDFKSDPGVKPRMCLKYIEGTGTCSVAISSLTDDELLDKLPSRVRNEILGPQPGTV